MTIAAVEGQPVVTDGDLLPKGSVITHVDGRPVAEVLARRLPLTQGGAPHRRLAYTVAGMLAGARDTNVALTIRLPDGTVTTGTLRRTGALPPPQRWSVSTWTAGECSCA